MNKFKSLFLLLLWALWIFSSQAQTFEPYQIDIVKEINTDISNGNYQSASEKLVTLQKEVPQYLGFYGGTFDLYMSICTEELHLKLGEEDFENYYRATCWDVNTSNSVRAKVLSEIAASLAAYGLNELSISYYQRIIKLKESVVPINYYGYMEELAWVYNNTQMPRKAYNTFYECAKFYKDKFGENSLNYARALNNMAYVARYINEDNLMLLLKVKQILETNNDTLKDKYAICLDNISATYLKRGRKELAMDYALRANRIFFLNDSASTDYVLSLNNIGSIYGSSHHLDSLEMAKLYYLRAYSISQTQTAIANVASLYDDLNMPDSAAFYYSKLDEFNKQTVDAKTLARHYAKIDDFDKYSYYMNKYFEYIKNVYQRNVPFMTVDERPEYIEFIQREDVDDLFNYAVERKGSNLSSLCYNYLLMSKSLMLSYEKSINNIVTQSSNKELQELFYSLKILRYNEQRTGQCSEWGNELERHFLDKLYEVSNFSAFMGLTYKDVQQKLTSSDVVLEFYWDKSHKLDKKLYVALLTYNNEPVIVECCSQNKATQLAKDHLLSAAIWSVIEPYIKDPQKVYFVPDGILHNYPFEIELESHIKNTKFYRLSSSRLLTQNPTTSGKNFAIYGGLSYSVDLSHIIDDAKSYRSDIQINDIDDSLNKTRSFSSDNQLDSLPWSLTEVNIIDSLITSQPNNAMIVDKYIKEQGTESAFKSLNGKKYRIIHIATHGFYFDGIEDPMMRSGLYLAGADMAEFVPSEIDDGCLYADEISVMNLQGLDLVVLSACDTGLGSINSDGVFGIQRGFKLAGANSLLMSLNRVDDEATCLLMTEFYKNWLGITNGVKMSKHDALEKARNTVNSQTNEGCNTPVFILLDALD